MMDTFLHVFHPLTNVCVCPSCRFNTYISTLYCHQLRFGSYIPDLNNDNNNINITKGNNTGCNDVNKIDSELKGPIISNTNNSNTNNAAFFQRLSPFAEVSNLSPSLSILTASFSQKDLEGASVPPATASTAANGPLGYLSSGNKTNKIQLAPVEGVENKGESINISKTYRFDGKCSDSRDKQGRTDLCRIQGSKKPEERDQCFNKNNNINFITPENGDKFSSNNYINDFGDNSRASNNISYVRNLNSLNLLMELVKRQVYTLRIIGDEYNNFKNSFNNSADNNNCVNLANFKPPRSEINDQNNSYGLTDKRAYIDKNKSIENLLVSDKNLKNVSVNAIITSDPVVSDNNNFITKKVAYNSVHDNTDYNCKENTNTIAIPTGAISRDTGEICSHISSVNIKNSNFGNDNLNNNIYDITNHQGNVCNYSKYYFEIPYEAPATTLRETNKNNCCCSNEAQIRQHQDEQNAVNFNCIYRDNDFNDEFVFPLFCPMYAAFGFCPSGITCRLKHVIIENNNNKYGNYYRYFPVKNRISKPFGKENAVMMTPDHDINVSKNTNVVNEFNKELNTTDDNKDTTISSLEEEKIYWDNINKNNDNIIRIPIVRKPKTLAKALATLVRIGEEHTALNRVSDCYNCSLNNNSNAFNFESNVCNIGTTNNIGDVSPQIINSSQNFFDFDYSFNSNNNLAVDYGIFSQDEESEESESEERGEGFVKEPSLGLRDNYLKDNDNNKSGGEGNTLLNDRRNNRLNNSATTGITVTCGYNPRDRKLSKNERSRLGFYKCGVCGYDKIGPLFTTKVAETYFYRYCPNCTTVCYLPYLQHFLELLIEEVAGDEYWIYKDVLDITRAHVVPDILKIPLMFEGHKIGTSFYAWSLVSPTDAAIALTTALEYHCTLQCFRKDTYLAEVARQRAFKGCEGNLGKLCTCFRGSGESIDTIKNSTKNDKGGEDKRDAKPLRSSRFLPLRHVISVGAGSGYVEHVFNRVINGFDCHSSVSCNKNNHPNKNLVLPNHPLLKECGIKSYFSGVKVPHFVKPSIVRFRKNLLNSPNSQTKSSFLLKLMLLGKGGVDAYEINDDDKMDKKEGEGLEKVILEIEKGEEKEIKKKGQKPCFGDEENRGGCSSTRGFLSPGGVYLSSKYSTIEDREEALIHNYNYLLGEESDKKVYLEREKDAVISDLVEVESESSDGDTGNIKNKLDLLHRDGHQVRSPFKMVFHAFDQIPYDNAQFSVRVKPGGPYSIDGLLNTPARNGLSFPNGGTTTTDTTGDINTGNGVDNNIADAEVSVDDTVNNNKAVKKTRDFGKEECSLAEGEEGCAGAILLICWPPFGSPQEEQSTMGYDTLRAFHRSGGCVVIYIGDQSSSGDWCFHEYLYRHYYLLDGGAGCDLGVNYSTTRREVRRWCPEEMGFVYAGNDTIGVYALRERKDTPC